ncbi:MAG TPA: acyl-CoA dehydrogenase family protein, partial [Caldisericia bacterium]|nr:acyl-CoA dehydrogenase family protein [Caldisericia bacterium]
MLDYFLNENQKIIRDLANKFAEERIKPVREELDRENKFPKDLIDELGKLDFMRIFIPKEFDGFGYGVTELCIVLEEISKACGGVGTSYAVNALGAYPIVKFGAEEQKKKYLP